MDIDGQDLHGNYNDGNRAFLQAFMARGQLSFKDAQKVLAAIFSAQEDKIVTPNEVTQEDFDSYVSAAADALSPLDYEIRSTQDQVTKVRVYGIINSISDPLTQMATTRSTEEIFYLKRLLDGMFETFNTKRREVMAITSMQAMEKRFLKGNNRQSEGEAINAIDKGLTGSEAEKFLQSLVDEKWLERSAAGFYRLSSRGLMELRSWLIDTYNEETDDVNEWQRIKFCEACKDIVTIGRRCAEQACNIRLHNICGAGYWSSRPDKKCPRCKTEWEGENYVGEKCILVTEEHLRGKRRSGITKRSRPEDEAGDDSSRRRSRRAEPEEQEEDTGGTEDDE